jgi:sugar lactone lactonase YvrE
MLNDPRGVAVDSSGNLYIADIYNSRIRKVATNGIITTVAGTNGSGYSGDGGPAANARLYYPYGVAMDSSGNLYIADSENSRIREVATNGIITTVAGTNSSGFSGDGGPAANASLDYPGGVAVDSSGNLYIADTDNQRIREVQLAGFPTLVLTNVSTNNAGNYTVLVTGPFGSVTSAVATVNVALSAPLILTGNGSFGFLTNQFGFNLSGPSGLAIVVDGSADLVNWTPLFTNTCASGSPFYFCDPCWTNFPLRFYRARLP